MNKCLASHKTALTAQLKSILLEQHLQREERNDWSEERPIPCIPDPGSGIRDHNTTRTNNVENKNQKSCFDGRKYSIPDQSHPTIPRYRLGTPLVNVNNNSLLVFCNHCRLKSYREIITLQVFLTLQ